MRNHILQNESDPKKAMIILIAALFLVSFFESKRISRLAPTAKTAIMREIGGVYSGLTEELKNVSGIAYFFNKEELFWKKLKLSPMIFDIPMPVIGNNLYSSKREKINPPYNVLIVGDSFIAESFGPLLEKTLLGYKDVTVIRVGIYSTGLSRPDYFNWQNEIRSLIDKTKPNIVIVMFGANDAQDIKDIDGKTLTHYGDKDWNSFYAKNTASFLNILKEYNIFVLWIGNPIARDNKYKTKIENLNKVFSETVSGYENAVYFSTWKLLADDRGNYTDYLSGVNGKKYLARASDGIHMTQFGASFIVDASIEELNNQIMLVTPEDIDK